MKNKKGNLLSEESVKVIMAVAVFAGIVYLMIILFSPVFNEADKTAEAYFESLEVAISEAGSVGNFFMLDNGDEDLNFYLVYFGDAVLVRKKLSFVDDIWVALDIKDEKRFIYSENGENVICVCSEDGDKIVCKYCDSLDLPAVFSKDESLKSWAVGEGVRVKIGKDGVKYDFEAW